jgi:hypothetical protein
MRTDLTFDKRIAAAVLALLAAPCSFSQIGNLQNNIRRVLLISIDGMHAVDYENCVAAKTCPTLAALGTTGVNYTRTSTSRPSDSFPGLMSIVTGGSPRLLGVFYDVAYDRVYAPPAKSTGNGVFAGTCTAGVPNGTTTEYEEGVDIDQTMVNGGLPGATLTDGTFQAIDPARLPRDPFNNCFPVYPWNFVRANTIFGVIKQAGGYTAWSDKHPVYAAVSGPTGTSNPSNLDDFYSPEINSNVVGLPGVTTPKTHAHPNGITCSDANGNPPDTNGVPGAQWTDSFMNIQCYDTLKVQAILNQIDSKTHRGAPARVPNIFGMNFQAVSVGEKLIENVNGTKVFGGYLDAAATPSPTLLDEIEFVDTSIGEMVSELQKQNLFDSTLIIITAKHGQSPIDPNRFKELSAGITTTPATVIANFLPAGSPENPNTPNDSTGLSPIGPTEDDISLLWLDKPSDAAAAVKLLEMNADAAGIGEIFYGPSLETMFNTPGVPPNGDPRSPDIVVQPYVGVIFTGSHKKQEEHGGFAHDDTNVMLLVSNSSFAPSTVSSFVETSQIAPTILKELGLDPTKLQAVQKEGTPVLPGLGLQ